MAEKTNDQLQDEIAQLRKASREKDAHIKEQAKALKVAEATRGKDAKPLVDVDGTPCEVQHAIVMRVDTTEGKKETLRLNAKQLAERPDLCKILLEQNSSAIRKVSV